MERVKSALLGSKLRILLTSVLSLVVVVAAAFSLGVLGAPSVAGVQNGFGDVTEQTTEIQTDLVVQNPNPIGISLGGLTVDYGVTMNDVAMANGTKKGISVGAGKSTVEFTTRMRNDRIPAWWVSHIRNDERTTLRVDATAHSSLLGRTFQAPPVKRQISTDVISQFNSSETRPINVSRPLVSDPVGYVNETGASWGEVTESETPIDLRLVVYNAKTPPMTITEIGYNITMNDVLVGQGTSDTRHVVEGHTTETIETQTVIQNAKLDEWWVSHLENEQVTELRIDFYAKVALGDEEFRVPLDEMSYAKLIDTDLFGNKASSDAGDSGDGSETTTVEVTDATDNATDGSDGVVTTPGDDDATTADDATATSDGETTADGSDDTTTTDDGVIALEPFGFGGAPA